MDNPGDSPTQPSKPKRSFFAKRPAPKAADNDGDIFHHSSQVFSSIIAEREAKLHLKAEKRSKKREEKEDRAREQSHKKRRISSDDGDNSDAEVSDTHRQSTPRGPRTRSQNSTPTKARKSSRITSNDADSLEPTAVKESHNAADAIEIDDDEGAKSDYDSLYDAPRHRSTLRKREDKAHEAISVLDDDAEEDEEYRQLIAEVKERTRQRQLEEQKRNAASVSSPNSTGADPSNSAPVLEIFIEPDIDDTKAAVIKVSIEKRVKDVREAWCKHNNLSPGLSSNIIITWRGHVQYDFTTLKTMLRILDASFDNNNNLRTYGKDEWLTPDLSKVHVLATTKERHAAREAEAKAAKAARPVELLDEDFPQESIENSQPKFVKIQMRNKEFGELKLKLYLVSFTTSGNFVYMLTVKQTDTFERAAGAFQRSQHVPEGKEIFLMVDGERLNPNDTVQDTDIEDDDVVEVYVR